MSEHTGSGCKRAYKRAFFRKNEIFFIDYNSILEVATNYNFFTP